MQVMNQRSIIGSLKVAILISAIGMDAARPILSKLKESEKKTIFKIRSQMGPVSSNLKEKIAKEFLESASPVKQIESDAADKEEEDAKMTQKGKNNLNAIQLIPPDQLNQLIRDEHPQTIALIIVHLKPNVASEVMELLPNEIKADVAFRIANLDKIVSGMIEEMDKVFEEILQNKDTSATQEAGGVPRLAEILNIIDSTSAEQIIEEIEENDPELAEQIKQMMFVFDDIVLVDDKGLQKVLRSVESTELAVALKAATDEVKDKIFGNMSKRAADILKEEMEVSGAVRMKDVTDAQQKITKIIQDMERKGELIISGRGGEEFVD